MKGVISSSLLVFFSCVLLAAAQSDLLVQTTNGPVIGHTTDTNKRWLAIPFAAPPVGNLRWQPPRSPASWTTPLNASSFAPVCPQGNDQTPLPPAYSEDCLYLNVFAPKNSNPNSNLPVYVWIFGGAWRVGYTQKYEGSFMAGQDIIVVTVSYRLGALGFMAHPLLLGHAPENTTGMYGIQDQRAGLQWVQNNIARFGGNPNKVTVGGQSAGAGCICVHLAAPRSAGLFQQAIMQSSFCSNLVDENRAYTTARNAVTNFGCVGTDEQILQCMLSLTPAQLITASISTPALNSYEILSQPSAIFARGSFNAVPLLVGNVWNESAQSPCANPNQANMSAATFTQNTRNSFPNNYEQVLEAYALSKYPTPVSASISISSDRTYKCPTKGAVDAYSRVQPNVWYYSLEQTTANPGNVPGSPSCLGTGHGFDNYYFFPSYLIAYSGSLTTTEQIFADQVRAAWVQFISNGAPQLPTGQDWPKYTFADGHYAALSYNNFHIETDYKQIECPIFNIRSPVCAASVSLTAIPGASWVSNGQNNQQYSVTFQNTGDKTILSANVRISTGSATITQRWNLNPVTSDVFSFPDYYKWDAYHSGGSVANDAGFILAGPDALAPTVSFDSLVCN